VPHAPVVIWIMADPTLAGNFCLIKERGKLPVLPEHLKPWEGLLPDGWPSHAGPLPDARAVAHALELGAPLGAKVGLAWVLYCRPEGATRSEIIAGCGGPQFNKARDAQRAGELEFMITRRPNGTRAYLLGRKGSRPGGATSVPVGEQAGDPEIFGEIRKLRNELAHNVPPSWDRFSELKTRFASFGPRSTKESSELLLEALRNLTVSYPVPSLLKQVVDSILEARSAVAVCDPWAGSGELLSTIVTATNPQTVLAFTRAENEATLGRVLLPNADWRVGEPLQLLNSLTTQLDVVASIVPFGARAEPLSVKSETLGSEINLNDDLGHLILAAASLRLSRSGLALFVVPASFFISARSVLKQFPNLGLSLDAALALPSGSFAPHTNIATYLLLVRKGALTKMFAAQLSNDANTNLQIISNLQDRKEGGTLELGRFVDPLSFIGLGHIRTAERFATVERQFGKPALRLGEIAIEINLGRSDESFEFKPRDNAIYVPLIGTSDVLYSVDELKLKRQNYAQVGIDPTKSNARFVAQFLNSELGKESIEAAKSGFIPKLNKQTLSSLRIFVPSIQTQRTMLELESRIAEEHNTVLSLQSELAGYRRELWSNPTAITPIDQLLIKFSTRLSGGLKQQAAQALDHWFETLPFPLASILRAWQATESQDFKTKHEHLLHFFEAAAQFTGIIFVSAFQSNEVLFESHRQKLVQSLQNQKLTLQRATFGTWKLITEYFGKQTRQLLSGDEDSRALCAEIFSDDSLVLPQVLSRIELADIISTTNKMRNDWTGHGGVVGQEDARLRNELLLSEILKVRELLADVWSTTQLVHALHCRPKRGVFENEIAILMGSNSEFLRETRAMATWLDVEQLYLSRKDSDKALRLLPLVKVGPAPASAKNACYFFSRLDRDGARYVSYHYTDCPELVGEFDEEATETIKMLTDG
jgi:hypothetical protein